MSVKDFIPKRNNIEVSLLQARIRRPIYRDLISKLRRESVSIKDFIEAAAQDYLKDEKAK